MVVLGVSGVRGGETARLIARNLRQSFKLVPAGALIKEAKARGLSPGSTKGRSQAARALRVAGVVRGKVSKVQTRWMLRLSIYSGHNGQQVGSVSFPMRGTRLDPTTLRRVTSALSNILARTRPGPRLESADPSRPEKPRRPQVEKVDQEPIEVEEVPLAEQDTDQDGQTAEEFDDGSVIDQSGDAGAVDDPALSFDPRALDKTKQGGSGSEAMGFDVPDYSPGAKPQEKARPAATEEQAVEEEGPTRRAAWESLVEADVGLLLISRSFNFNAPVTPPDPADYSSGMVSALQLNVTGYPLGLLGGGFLANLGLTFSYWRVFGLESMMSSYAAPLGTTLHQGELGLHYRWNFLGKAQSPVLKTGLGFGLLEFGIDWPTAPLPLPNLSYKYLNLIASLDWPYLHKGGFTHGVGLHFLFLYAFSAGFIEREDSGGYGSSLTTGLEGGASLFAAYKGFTAKIHGFYRRIGFQFDATCASLGTGCNVAGGALDVYLGVGFTVGYAY